MKKHKLYRISVALSMEAYKNASKIYNEGKKNNEKLKDFHYHIYFQLVRKLAQKVKLNKEIKQNDCSRLRITRPELGKIFEVSSQTITNRLKRLNESGFIKIVFRGSKSPLEIIFSKDLAILYDAMDLEFVPNSKFLSTNAPVTYEHINKNFDNIKDTENTRPEINITITDNDLTNSFTRTYETITENTKKELKPTFTEITEKEQETTFTGAPPAIQLAMLSPEKQETAKMMADAVAKANNISYDEALKSVLKGVKPEKKKNSAPAPDLQNSENQKTTIYDTKDSELVHSILHKEKILREKASLEERRKELRLIYVRMFIHYLIDTLFADKKKQFTERYYNEIIDYVNENYFSHCETMQEMDFRWDTYKYRIDVAAKLIKKDPNFDKTFFYPLAYLQIDKKGKNHFSFVNTAKFLDLKKDWESKNNFNRKLDSQIKKALNTIYRQYELKHISYDDAKQKVMNLSKDNQGLINLFNYRITSQIKN